MVSVYMVFGVIVAMIYCYILVGIPSNKHVLTTIPCNVVLT
jgi:hypothetical protein